MTKKTVIIGSSIAALIGTIAIFKKIKREKHIKKVLTGIGIPEPIVVNMIKIYNYPFNKKVKDYIMYKYLEKHIDELPDFQDIEKELETIY